MPVTLTTFDFLDPASAMREMADAINALEQGGGGGAGAQGPPGPAGPQGDAGPAGAQGPPGPTAISTDTGNLAALGTDGLIFVPPTPIVPGAVHYVRVFTADNALNAAVANGGVLQFDTIDNDTDGFAPAAAPFSMITIPVELGGVYVINGWSSGTGSQATSLGMGLHLNSNTLTGTNQSISGPAAVNYTLDNAAIAILQLNAGDTIGLFNTSVSGGTNAFTAVFLSLVRIEPGLIFQTAS